MNPNLPEFKQELIKKRAKAEYASISSESAKSVKSVKSDAPSSSGVQGGPGASKRAVTFGKTKNQRQYHDPEGWDENTVHGPIQNPSLLRRGCDSCASFANRICYFLPCKCPTLADREFREDLSNVEDVHEAPGVTLASKPKAAGLGISVGMKEGEDTDKLEDKDAIIYQKNLETILDYAAKSLNLKIVVENSERLSEAVALLGTRVRSIQPRIMDDQTAHMPGETFYAGKAFKPGKWRSSVWKERYFKLQYDGSLKYFNNETTFNSKGVFTIDKDTVVAQPIMENGKYLVKIKNGALENFIVALPTIEEATMWAGHFRSIIDFKSIQARSSQPAQGPAPVRRVIAPAAAQGRTIQRRPATGAAPATAAATSGGGGAAAAARQPVQQRSNAAPANPAYYHTENAANQANTQRRKSPAVANDRARQQQQTTTRSVMSQLSK